MKTLFFFLLFATTLFAKDPQYKVGFGLGVDYALFGVNLEVALERFHFLYGISAVELEGGSESINKNTARGHVVGLKYFFTKEGAKLRQGVGVNYGAVDAQSTYIDENELLGIEGGYLDKIVYGLNAYYELQHDVGEEDFFKFHYALGYSYGGPMPIAFAIGVGLWL